MTKTLFLTASIVASRILSLLFQLLFHVLEELVVLNLGCFGVNCFKVDLQYSPNHPSTPIDNERSKNSQSGHKANNQYPEIIECRCLRRWLLGRWDRN